MRNFSFVPAALVLLFASSGCEKQKPEPQTAPASSASVTTASASGAPAAASASATATPAAALIAMRTVPVAEVPKDIVAPGKVLKAIGWTDKNGENFVVFSTQKSSGKKGGDKFESAYLNVEHVASPGGVRKSLRTVKDKEENCSDDMTAEFRDKALAVTDLDNDGIGEVTFAYALNCTSDVSPATLKLLMLENGDKYILRGQARVDLGAGGGKVGGDFKADPSFKDGPPAFLEHAKKQWTAVRSE